MKESHGVSYLLVWSLLLSLSPFSLREKEKEKKVL
jgi:hypothetical protein